MKTLRALTWLRLVLLAGFLSALGVAAASPFVQPLQTHVVCAGAGVAVVTLDHDGAPLANTALDCPFCLPAHSPAPVACSALPKLPLPHTCPLMQDVAGVVSPSAAPPPGRGPPFFS